MAGYSSSLVVTDDDDGQFRQLRQSQGMRGSAQEQWYPREEVWGELAELVAVESGGRFSSSPRCDDEVNYDDGSEFGNFADSGDGEYPRVYAAIVDEYADVAKRCVVDHTPDRSGETALIAACRRGAIQAVQNLVAAGANVEAKDARGRTALEIATLAGQLGAAKSVVRAGATVSTTDCSLLRQATHEGDFGLVSLLLERGAPALTCTLDTRTPLGSADEERGATSCLIVAARHAIPAVLEAFVTWANGRSQLLDAPHGTKRVTALMVAAAHSKDDSARAVRTLLDAKVDVVLRDVEGYSALHRAAMADSARAVEALADAANTRLSKSKYSEWINSQTKGQEQTALHCAALVEAAAATSALLRAGADAMLFEAHNRTALALAKKATASEASAAVVYDLEAMTRAVSDGDFTTCVDLAKRKNWAIDAVVEGLEDTPLVAACRTGDADAVLLLIQDGGARLDARNALSETPLGVAVKSRRLEVCATLVKAGASPRQALDDGGADLLVLACLARDSSLVEQLLVANQKTPLPNEALRKALHAAASNADDDAVEALLRHSPSDLYDDVTPPSPNGTPTRGGKMDSLWPMRESMPSMSEKSDEEAGCYLTQFPEDGDAREPALLAACRTGAMACVKALSKQSSTKKSPLRTALDDEGRCALHHASATDRASVVERLCSDDPALVACRDARGATSLHAAAAAGAGAAIGALLRHGADATLADSRKRTPHDVALEYGHDRAALQLDAMGAAIDDGDFDECARLANAGNWPIDWRALATGDTALVAAARRGAPDGVSKLLLCGAAVDAASTPSDNKTKAVTPLGAAALAGHLDVCAALLAAGASPTELDDRAASLLEAAVVADEPELVDALLAKGADARPAFLVGVELGSPEIVASFVKRAVEPKLLAVDTTYTETRTTALQAAATRGRAVVVNKLLEAGANVDLLDSNGRSALHHAAAGDHDDVLRVLVSSGANVRRKDASGQTPLAIATNLGAKAAESALRMAESMLHRA